MNARWRFGKQLAAVSRTLPASFADEDENHSICWRRNLYFCHVEYFVTNNEFLYCTGAPVLLLTTL